MRLVVFGLCRLNRDKALEHYDKSLVLGFAEPKSMAHAMEQCGMADSKPDAVSSSKSKSKRLKTQDFPHSESGHQL
ncbi:MAG: hypothetical protein ACI9F9_000002 [Candidatus Paceibacteria bacterium]